MTILEKLKSAHDEYLQESNLNKLFKLSPARFDKKLFAYVSSFKAGDESYTIITEQDEQGEVFTWMKKKPAK